MTTPAGTPIERFLADLSARIGVEQRNAFLVAMAVSVLAYGFEMTNLTLHHDDVVHLLVEVPLVGYFLGRFGFTWIFHYAQSGHYSPFLHMTLGMAATAAYGLVVSRLWGLRRTVDIALVTTVLCVFPYMAQIYQYNSAMVAFPIAHLLAASGVLLATRARTLPVALAALLFTGAFSIYQAVLANAATIFAVWLLSRHLPGGDADPGRTQGTWRSVASVAIAGVAGGLLYVALVALMKIDFGSAQAADKAFSLSHRLEHGLQFVRTAGDVLRGTRSFLFWPENYFPDWLKKAQLVLVAGAAVLCAWVPSGLTAKVRALALLGLVLVAPRTMQLLHPQGNYHNLTLTAYGVLVAGAVMVVVRSGPTTARNLGAVVATVVIAGYVVQCSWMSTVNHLNTLAHYSTLTQVLSRVRSLPDQNWDGKTVAVVGSYDMRSDFPFRPGTGLANEYMDVAHMIPLARLMRDDVRFVAADGSMPKVLEYAATREPWPHPRSVGIVDGMAVVVLSRK